MYDESNAKVVRLVVRDLAVRIGSRDVMVELTKSHYTCINLATWSRQMKVRYIKQYESP